MSKMKIKVPGNKYERRSPEAYDAKNRRAPTMDHRLEPRGGSRDWHEYLDDDYQE